MLRARLHSCRAATTGGGRVGRGGDPVGPSPHFPVQAAGWGERLAVSRLQRHTKILSVNQMKPMQKGTAH